jgi:hypothetical protein
MMESGIINPKTKNQKKKIMEGEKGAGWRTVAGGGRRGTEDSENSPS